MENECQSGCNQSVGVKVKRWAVGKRWVWGRSPRKEVGMGRGPLGKRWVWALGKR